MKVKQLEKWGEIIHYALVLNRPVYMLYAEGENMIMANNKEFNEVVQAFDDGVPFVILEEEDG